MQLSGASSIEAMRRIDVVVTGETRNWLTLRGFEDTLKTMAQRRFHRASGEA
jgi:isopentenyl-diphosphate delta-isomerase